MARYKEYTYEQTKLIPIAFSQQILAGTFEYTLNYLIDNEFDLSSFEQRYHNEETGAPAYDPAILLKIILYGYVRGITSSREIERSCRENIIFMALSADTHPHFTTIADFISSRGEQIIELFRDVLLICDKMGLIGKEMFAIDGCKLASMLPRSGGNQGRVKEQAAKDGAGSAVLGREAPGEGRQARVQSCGRTRAEADREASGEDKKA